MTDQARIIDEQEAKKKSKLKLTEHNAADIAAMIKEQLKM